MYKFVACLAVVAMLAYTASANTPCTQICGGQCALAKQACAFSGLLGTLCDATNKACVAACAGACKCVDDCAKKCGTEYNTCKAKDKAVLNVLNCGLNLSTCGGSCQATCRFNQLAALVNSLAAPPAKG